MQKVCICGSKSWTKQFTYRKTPPGEIQFHFSSQDIYFRELFRCEVCGHFISIHAMDDQKLYGGDYATSNYGGAEGIRKTFEKIRSLDPHQSDNVGRVDRVIAFSKSYFSHGILPKTKRTVLDIGSGLCVFLDRMKNAGWEGTALDPDPEFIKHAQETVGVKTVHADFSKEVPARAQFDVVALNRVLEHVAAPLEMLSRVRNFVCEPGFVYVELPDGEYAARESLEREEFFIDHKHIFSFASAAHLATRAGFDILLMERLREPSRKYTLRMFLHSKRDPS